MAKRSRGAARPGQRPTTRRPQQRPAGRGTAATADSMRAVARPIVDDLDADLEPAESRQATGTARNPRDRVEPAQVSRVRSGQASGLLAARAAEEYGYVARDIRHIGVVGGGLLVILIVLWVLIEVVRVIQV